MLISDEHIHGPYCVGNNSVISADELKTQSMKAAKEHANDILNPGPFVN